MRLWLQLLSLLRKEFKLGEVYAVVLAGGSGKRLWPLSRRRRPKQFLDLTGDGAMLCVTTSRLLRFLPWERIIVVTVPEHVELVREMLPELSSDNLLIEPSRRGTGPCVVLAALNLKARDREATMIIVPSDHVIIETEQYLDSLQLASKVAAQSGAPISLGLRPTRPATNYGYIQLGVALEQWKDRKVFKALRFVEKPAIEIAQEFCASGDYLWNTGTFAWRVSSFLGALQQGTPEFVKGITVLLSRWHAGVDSKELSELYAQLPDISIDYALLERVDNLLVLEGSYQRIDVGDLVNLTQLWPADDKQNAGRGEWRSHKSSRNTIYSEGPLVALVGVSDTVVVVTKDVVLVCAKSHSQDIQALLDGLDAPLQARYG